MEDLSRKVQNFDAIVESAKEHVRIHYPSLEPDDAVQEALVKSSAQATKYPERWSTEKDVRANIHVNLQSVCKDMLKKNHAQKREGGFQRQQISSLASHLAGQFTSPSDKLSETERQEIISEVLSTLSADEQQLIYQRIHLNSRYSEIAEQTGLSEGALRVQFLRLTKKLEPLLRAKGLNTTFLSAP